MATTTSIGHGPDLMLTAHALRGMRRLMGLTQRDIAHRSGCSLTCIANLEAGLIPRRSDALNRVAMAIAGAVDDTLTTERNHANA